ncbi:MAG: helix-turn-helix transcriptional regulator [Crocinitomicaceae bacterium]|nr:helix-turn-helix transcriptional regulator [Crocinitomicaceae bacterium]
MKVLPFKIPKHQGTSLIYQVDHGERFYNLLHQHEEIQLSFIVSGEGDLLVGDSIHQYRKGDILLIGSNLPHLLQSSEHDDPSHMVSLFFSYDSFGSDFFNQLEFDELKKLLNSAASGIIVHASKHNLDAYFVELETCSPLEKFINFMSILKEINRCEYEILSSFIYQRTYSENDGTRMSKIMNFAITQYHREVSLDEVANIANMTPNAFCRYFKTRTNKTFFQFLLEIRLEYASRLLLEKKELSISEVCTFSGFKNLSHFNRKFKQIKGHTPSQWRSIHS